MDVKGIFDDYTSKIVDEESRTKGDRVSKAANVRSDLKNTQDNFSASPAPTAPSPVAPISVPSMNVTPPTNGVSNPFFGKGF